MVRTRGTQDEFGTNIPMNFHPNDISMIFSRYFASVEKFRIILLSR